MDINQIQIGDVWCYPGIGPVRLRDMFVEQAHGKVQRTTKWIPVNQPGITHIIAQDKLDKVLRPLTSQGEVIQLFEALSEPNTLFNEAFSQRCRDQKEKLRVGGALELAEMCRDLYRRKKTGEPHKLAQTEKENLDKAMQMLVAEVSLALECEPAVARKRIEEAIEKPLKKPKRKIPYV